MVDPSILIERWSRPESAPQALAEAKQALKGRANAEERER
jgi:hypothetical protein